MSEDICDEPHELTLSNGTKHIYHCIKPMGHPDHHGAPSQRPEAGLYIWPR